MQLEVENWNFPPCQNYHQSFITHKDSSISVYTETAPRSGHISA
jgi:hypothetical protein